MDHRMGRAPDASPTAPTAVRLQAIGLGPGCRSAPGHAKKGTFCRGSRLRAAGTSSRLYPKTRPARCGAGGAP
eukprot:6567656-Alexandrium_andersonii.AAC.1